MSQEKTKTFSTAFVAKLRKFSDDLSVSPAEVSDAVEAAADEVGVELTADIKDVAEATADLIVDEIATKVESKLFSKLGEIKTRVKSELDQLISTIDEVTNDMPSEAEVVAVAENNAEAQVVVQADEDALENVEDAVDDLLENQGGEAEDLSDLEDAVDGMLGK